MSVELLLKNGFHYLGRSKNGLNVFKKTSENMADTCFAMTDSLGNIVRGGARNVEHFRYNNASVNSATWGFTDKDVFQKVTKSRSLASYEIPELFNNKTYKSDLNEWFTPLGAEHRLLDGVEITYAPTVTSYPYYPKYLSLYVDKKTNRVYEGVAVATDAQHNRRSAYQHGTPFDSVSDIFARTEKKAPIRGRG